MKKQKTKIKDLERGLVSVEDYQKIKSAIEGKDNYHKIIRDSQKNINKKDFTPYVEKKKISIDELLDIELKETDNQNTISDTLH